MSIMRPIKPSDLDQRTGYDFAVLRSLAPGNLNVRIFEGHDQYTGYTLILEKWSDKMSLFAANSDHYVNFDPLLQYSPFTQVETTNTMFGGQLLTKTCPLNDVYDTKKQNLPQSRADTCATGSIVGITLASIREVENIFSIQAMSYGLRSRFEEGNLEYLVYFGGANSGNGMLNNGFDGPFGSEQKIFVLEKWDSFEALEHHLKTSTVDYIKDASGLVAQPTSVYMNSHWTEILPANSPTCAHH
jgi:quinol monooxygenase YgiN